jgi:hypothetical protein
MNRSQLPLRSSEMRDEDDMSASDSLIAPSSPILFPAWSENELMLQLYYGEAEVQQEMNLI